MGRGASQGSPFVIAILSYLLLILGFVLLVKGADLLLDGVSSVARRFNISDVEVLPNR
jgi:Ca2+/Na+ antiporter